jgi:hypothetical protein
LGYKICMKKKTDLPPGWAMPEDQASNLKKNLIKKSKPPEQVLDEALKEIARDIAILEPHPQDWQGWVSIFLDHLEAEACKKRETEPYQGMLKSLGSSLSIKQVRDK